MTTNMTWKFLIILSTLQINLLTAEATDINWAALKSEVCTTDYVYNRFKAKNNPVDVSVALTIVQIYDFNEEKMEFKLQTVIKLFWVDPFLNFRNNTEIRSIPPDVDACLWKPDITFYNCKETSEFSVMIPNSVTKVYPGGTFYTYSRYSITVACILDLRNYPMDNQNCSLYIQFVSSRNNEALLRWLHTSQLDVSKNIKSIQGHNYINIKLQQFKMDIPVAASHNIIYTSGNTTVLDCQFKFSRYATSSIINVYLPSFLVVWLAYISFYLDVNAVPGRVTLGVTAFLTIATQMVSVRVALPTVNYITAIDFWLFGCLILVFMSLIEFTFAYTSSYSVDNNDKSKVSLAVLTKTRGKQIQSLRGTSASVIQEIGNTAHCCCLKQCQSDTINVSTTKKKCNQVDRLAKSVYPIFALGFAICYWIYYTYKISIHA